MKKLLKFIVVFSALIFSGTNLFAQGNTNASMVGKVSEISGVLPGATVVAVHTPSGSKYGTSTDNNGYFKISNMRVGGPYKVTISYVGYKTEEIGNVFLQLGDSQNVSIILTEDTSALNEVVITGGKDNVFNSKKTGAQTIIDSKKINSLPSLSRNISDFARLTPQAQIRNDDQISISGQNNRYNAIYIDGAVNNDVFGLADNGTNGGQTGVSPISLDAIEQFQVQVAPFDVKISGFAGGAISAITRSGTNDFEGSAYFLGRNQDIAGKTPPSLVAAGSSREKLSDFTAYTAGIRAGGAIIKDKLFYFINYERQNNETVQPFDIGLYNGNAKTFPVPGLPILERSTANTINYLRNELVRRYGYDVGGYTNKLATLVSDKLIAKVDYNFNDNHKLAVRHSYVKADNVSPNRTSTNAINFENGAQIINSVTNSTSLELNSKFSDKISNNFVVGYTSVNDDRGFIGNPFPYLIISDDAGTINVGSENFSTANLLEQKILTITNNLEIALGKHNLTVGFNFEKSDAKNVFFGNNFGTYNFENETSGGTLVRTGLERFLNNMKPSLFQLGYSLVGGTGDNSQGVADFTVNQWGAYLQDEFRVADNFKLTYGIRFDVPVWDSYINNQDFNEGWLNTNGTRELSTVELLQAAGKDLKGARVGQPVATKVHFSPRLGFNYDVFNNKKTQLRGGVGVFTSRLPLVWPGGAYSNNGVTQGAIEISGITNPNMPFFNPNTNAIVEPITSGSIPNSFSPLYHNNISNTLTPLGVLPGNAGKRGNFSGNVDLFASNFRLPQVLKASLAIDQKLPYGILFSADATWNDNISAIKYENLNISNPTVTMTGADNRPRYTNPRIDGTYNRITLASNTSEGYAWNTSYTFSKTFTTDRMDVFVQGTHAYGDSKVLFDATSSQNSSQWRNIETVNGSNRIGGVSTSDFAQGHRFLGVVSFNYKWSEYTKTKLGLYYEGVQGTPVSYVYAGTRFLGDTSSNSALIFIPANQSQINLLDNPLGLNAQQQWEALDQYIRGNDYLNSRRGTYAERNGHRLKMSHIVDLKFAQEFTITSGKQKHNFEITADIFNFTNLLNQDWGKRYFASNDQVQLINHIDFAPGTNTPRFRFNPAATTSMNQVDDAGLNSSRWQAQLGVRYTFN
jgi:hypothetical protein